MLVTCPAARGTQDVDSALCVGLADHDGVSGTEFAISPLGIVFCLYKTQEDIQNIIFVKVPRGV